MATNIMSRNTRPNPYVGPRSFEAHERLYGRDTETRKLANLLGAERIVLLHSPSGAGKTSLIQAALIPRMQQRKFHVRPVARVNREFSGNPDYNRYIFSLLSSLEDDQPEDARKSDKELAGLTLAAYLEQRPKPENRKFELFVFDQFEEIVTLNPTDQAAKHDFFAQLGEALEDRSRWALFAMREDFVGALAPYRLPIPNRLRVTFRLDLLGEAAALQAIQNPAQAPEVGVFFDDVAAQTLVDDLRRVRIQRPDGSFETQLGPYVEPLQLQVICYRLWESLSPDDNIIDQNDLAALGDVGQALADYYAERVNTIASESNVRERVIREWFHHKLISEQGIRTPVLMGTDTSEGLTNSAVRALENAHVVRAEKRGGATWYELAHDRLVDPIRKNNNVWFDTHLHFLQRRAVDWHKQGRPHDLLLRGDALKRVKDWVAQNAEEFNQIEADFWDACQEVERQAKRQRLKNQLIFALFLINTALLCVAAYFFVDARQQTKHVERILFIRKLLSQAAQQRDELGALLARQAYVFQQQDNIPLPVEVDQTLRDVVRPPYFTHILREHTREVRSVAFSPDNRFLASAGWDKRILLWELGQSASRPKEIGRLDEGIWSIAFSPDGNTLVSGSNAEVAMWDLDQPAASPSVLLEGSALSVAISGDNRWIAAGMPDGIVTVWNRETMQPLALTPETDDNHIWSVTFSSDGKWMAAGGRDAEIRLWPLPFSENTKPIMLIGHTDPIRALAFRPDSTALVSGSDDGTMLKWTMPESPEADIIQNGSFTGTATALKGHTDKILALAFGPNGRQLTSSSSDGTVRLWNIDSPQAEATILSDYQSITYAIAFSSNGQYMALGTADTTVHVRETQKSTDVPRLLTDEEASGDTTAFARQGTWLAAGGETKTKEGYAALLWDLSKPDRPARLLPGHDAPVQALAFSPSANRLVSSSNGTLRVWDPQNPDIPLETWTTTFEDQFDAVAFSPDGSTLATANDYGNILLWKQTGKAGKFFSDHEDRIKRKPDKFFPDHEDRIFALAFSPDGSMLASGSVDRTIRLWNLKNPDADPVVFSDESIPPISSVAFHPTESLLATGGEDGRVRIWDLNDPQNLKVLTGHTSAVLAVAFSPEGNFLVSGSIDHTGRLWDLAAPDDLPRILPTGTGSVVFVDFLTDQEDKEMVMIGVDDGRLFLWPVPTRILAAYVCDKVWRNLTQEEWETFLGLGISYQPTCENLPLETP